MNIARYTAQGVNIDMYTAQGVNIDSYIAQGVIIASPHCIARCSAYIFAGVKNVPDDVSAHARYM